MITPGHRRSLNRALHELRRPLQALVLLDDPPARPAAPPSAAGRRGLLELITTALDDLDRAVNGGEESTGFRRFSCREHVFACLERWRHAAAPAGGFRVYWDAGPAPVEGDPARLAQALDNLVANALEHGGPPLLVTGARVAGRVRITIANGSAEACGGGSVRRDGDSADPRRGHGTDLVTEVASAHRGRFALCHTGGGSVAALELPLAEPGYARAA
ncbi:MAG TPA: ATP-binding protein [Solirubrobacterales bacterium]|nr:ATP-binding protein [Solirubrobacterales bacterium]HEU4980053.1 ATP-binding protein [Solirubrobacterales bacterium]